MSLSTSEQLKLLMDVNKLSYSPPVDGSLANSRQLKKYAFTPLNYSSGGQPQITINSGSDYISGPSSFILLNVKYNATNNQLNAAADNPGSAFNFIREFQISHRSGDVIDRTDALNNLVAELVRYSYDSSYSEKFAKVFGYGDDDPYNNVTVTYALPLFLFSGLFAQKALIPSHLMAGARIKIQLEDPAVAIFGAGGGYSIENCNLVLDSIDLFDAAKKTLMEQASNVRTQGLQYPYYSWFNLRKDVSDTSLNFDMNLSAAKTMVLLIKTRLTANLVAGQDSMIADFYKYTNWRARIGSHTMPQHEVETPEEAYMITMEAHCANPDGDLIEKRPVECGVSFDYFKGAPSLAISLEKSTIVALSGEVTNNTRLLNFTASYLDAANRRVDAYIKHLRVANVMIDNVVIDR